MPERTSIIHVQDPVSGECYTTRVISNHPVPPTAVHSVEATKAFYRDLGLEVLSITRVEDGEIAINEPEISPAGAGTTSTAKVSSIRLRRPSWLGVTHALLFGGLIACLSGIAVLMSNQADDEADRIALHREIKELREENLRITAQAMNRAVDEMTARMHEALENSHGSLGR